MSGADRRDNVPSNKPADVPERHFRMIHTPSLQGEKNSLSPLLLFCSERRTQKGARRNLFRAELISRGVRSNRDSLVNFSIVYVSR